LKWIYKKSINISSYEQTEKRHFAIPVWNKVTGNKYTFSSNQHFVARLCSFGYRGSYAKGVLGIYHPSFY
jgi:hypothetical protein